MTSTVRVAVAQVPASFADVPANLAGLAAHMEEAARDGVRLLVFPECYLTGYMFDDRETAQAVAISADGAEIGEITALCVRHGLEVVVGFLEKRQDRLHNSAAVIGPSGVIGIHRKRHLPCLGVDRFLDEPDGIEPSVFDTRAGRLGVAICY